MSFPFDATGTSPGNLIPNEIHVTTTTDASRSQYFVAQSGPFFARGFSVYSIGESRFLTPGVDYVFAVKFQQGTDEIGENIYKAIALTKQSIAGSFIFNYQTIGGPYVQDLVGILEDGFAELDTIVNLKYDDIAPDTLPATFPPTAHNEVLNTLDGYTAFLEKMTVLTDTIKSRTTEIKLSDVVDLDTQFVSPMVEAMAGIAASFRLAELTNVTTYLHYTSAGAPKDAGVVVDSVWKDTTAHMVLNAHGTYLILKDDYLNPTWPAAPGVVKSRLIINGQAISSHSNKTSIISVTGPTVVRMQVAVFGSDVNRLVYGDSDDHTNLTAIKLNGIS